MSRRGHAHGCDASRRRHAPHVWHLAAGLHSGAARVDLHQRLCRLRPSRATHPHDGARHLSMPRHALQWQPARWRRRHLRLHPLFTRPHAGQWRRCDGHRERRREARQGDVQRWRHAEEEGAARRAPRRRLDRLGIDLREQRADVPLHMRRHYRVPLQHASCFGRLGRDGKLLFDRLTFQRLQSHVDPLQCRRHPAAVRRRCADRVLLRPQPAHVWQRLHFDDGGEDPVGR